MKIKSLSFDNLKEIPIQYTCLGANISPSLLWGGVPKETKSFVLIVEDPDAPDPNTPGKTWTHWILYNISPDTNKLVKGVDELPPWTLKGLNDWGKTEYCGPCPNIGRHRYFFNLYALDSMLPDLNKPDRLTLLWAMNSHVLEVATIVGTFESKRQDFEMHYFHATSSSSSSSYSS